MAAAILFWWVGVSEETRDWSATLLAVVPGGGAYELGLSTTKAF
jgi:hypothetical protein